MTLDPGPMGESFLVSTTIDDPDLRAVMEHSTMKEFIRNTLSRQKLQQLCVNTAFGNFVGYVAGSLVMVFTTYRSVERRALKNLFGILPRHEVVVHRLPEWLEWTLAVFLGYLVMEFVRYVIRSNRYLLFINGPAQGKARDDQSISLNR